ncbi:MAG TPA: hypothetical protein VLW88_10370 [Hyphomicrobium sp.]|nr:hypothetical protein [Hyphomicrobium sp.]
MSMQDLKSSTKPLRWVANVIERSPDLLAIGGGMIGVALIAGVIIVGLHERQNSFRVMAPAEQGDSASYR